MRLSMGNTACRIGQPLSRYRADLRRPPCSGRSGVRALGGQPGRNTCEINHVGTARLVHSARPRHAGGRAEEVAMPVTRLNHAVLYVRDVDRSVALYGDALGFRAVMAFPGAAFLQAPGGTNDHDLGLFQVGLDAGSSEAGAGRVGLYHLAWEVDTLDELDRIARKLSDLGSLVGASDHGTTKALYAKDPDGIEFEVSWLVPANRLDEAALSARSRIGPLDIAKEKERYGATTRGGVGISTPVTV